MLATGKKPNRSANLRKGELRAVQTSMAGGAAAAQIS